MNFKSLKKSSENLDRLAQALEKENDSGYEQDNRFWYPEVDKAGNGSAVIRFLPAPAVDGDEGLPWVKIFSHGFKGPSGKWYIENSLTTFKQKDPASEFNNKLWNMVTDEEDPKNESAPRKQAKAQKRKLGYVCGIKVISDPKNPENDGTIRLYRVGKKIFDKIELAMNPEFAGDKKMNPFDFWEGANFKIRIRNKDNYRNYDESSFESPSKLSEDDAELEKIWNSQHSLKAFLADDQFKSYDELLVRLNEVMGFDTTSDTGKPAASKADSSSPREKFASKQTPKAEDDDGKAPFETGDDDDDLKYFQGLRDAD